MLNTWIMYKSQNTILWLVQKDHLVLEHHNLKSHTLSERSIILPLALILVNNLTEVGGRIRHSNITDQEKQQTIFWAAHHFILLIVIYFQEKYHYCGRDQTLASIRERFGIINGKSVLKRILDNCQLCRRLKVTPKPQLISDKAWEKLATNEPAFS